MFFITCTCIHVVMIESQMLLISFYNVPELYKRLRDDLKMSVQKGKIELT